MPADKKRPLTTSDSIEESKKLKLSHSTDIVSSDSSDSINSIDVLKNQNLSLLNDIATTSENSSSSSSSSGSSSPDLCPYCNEEYFKECVCCDKKCCSDPSCRLKQSSSSCLNSFRQDFYHHYTTQCDQLLVPGILVPTEHFFSQPLTSCDAFLCSDCVHITAHIFRIDGKIEHVCKTHETQKLFSFNHTKKIFKKLTK